MDRADIFRKLIDTDKNAQKLYADAVSHQESLSEEFSQMIHQLREQKYAEADASITASEDRALIQSNSRISDLNYQLEQSLTELEKVYVQNREKWSDIIFEAAINGCDNMESDI